MDKRILVTVDDQDWERFKELNRHRGVVLQKAVRDLVRDAVRDSVRDSVRDAPSSDKESTTAETAR